MLVCSPQAVLLEARVFPGELVSVVRLSTESEKSAKEKELHPKTQSVLKGEMLNMISGVWGRQRTKSQ